MVQPPRPRSDRDAQTLNVVVTPPLPPETELSALCALRPVIRMLFLVTGARGMMQHALRGMEVAHRLLLRLTRIADELVPPGRVVVPGRAYARFHNATLTVTALRFVFMVRSGAGLEPGAGVTNDTQPALYTPRHRTRPIHSP